MGNGASGAPARPDGPVSRLAGIYQWQPPMMRVLASLAPIVLAAVYLFGWRAMAVIAVCVLLCTLTEWAFCRRRGEKVTSAVLVTALLLALTLPPTVPLMVVGVAAVVAVAFGKEVFGGFGRNVYNPALVGRCFVYVCFPVAMTSRWVAPFSGFPAGLARWAPGADAFTRATPLAGYVWGEGPAELGRLLLGNTSGSLGETSAVLILAGGAYLLLTKTANWRIVVSCLAGGAIFSALFHWALGSPSVPGPLYTLLAGGFMFASVYMATDPVSAPATNPARYVYGIGIGALTVIIRGFSNFAGGVMFAILLMNTFTPIMDHYVNQWQGARRRAVAASEG